MKKTMLVVMAVALAPMSAFGVDGVFLINQSTVMAAGGFPFVISQPGSYKLSGNLTAPINTTAINITASLVTLDLNGFNVSCATSFAMSATCIVAADAISSLTIMNGTIKIDEPQSIPEFRGIIGIHIGSHSSVHDVSVLASNELLLAIQTGTFGNVRNNTTNGLVGVGDLSLLVENVAFQIFTGLNCKTASNIGINNIP
jgi:hypothetical protein